MIKNKKRVQEVMRDIRPAAADYFIPLGGMDMTTDAKREISNLTQTLSNHLPLVRDMVAGAAPYPVYVGYDGRDFADRAGTYYRNLVLLHQAADESSAKFILAYTHELTHMMQDRAGLLRADEVAKPQELVDFLAHNLMLEAAALATEVSCIYYLSKHSHLADDFEEIEELFDDYIAENTGRAALYGVVAQAAERHPVKDFADIKPIWRAVFQQFFAPDSAFLAHYIKDFCQSYINRIQTDMPFAKKPWGRDADMAAITTLPGMGALFGAEGVEILQAQIRAAVLQDKFMPSIDMARSIAQRLRPQEPGNAMLIDALLRINDGHGGPR